MSSQGTKHERPEDEPSSQCQSPSSSTSPRATKKPRGNWDPTEDALIKSLYLTRPQPLRSAITDAVNALPGSPGNRTPNAVSLRWLKHLQHETEKFQELNEEEMEMLEMAWENVTKREVWKYVCAEYAELVKEREGCGKKTLGRGAAKYFLGEKKKKKEAEGKAEGSGGDGVVGGRKKKVPKKVKKEAVVEAGEEEEEEGN